MAYDLYWISGSPNAWRVMLGLELKGLEYTAHRLDPVDRSHKTPEYLAMNPRGKVPVLKNGKTVVYESVAILAYLEAKHPDPPLFGTTPEETGHIWQRISEFENYTRGPWFAVALPIFTGKIGENVESIKASAKESHEELFRIEEILMRMEYLAGDHLSAADLVTLTFLLGFLRAVTRDDAAGLDLNFSNFDELYPNIANWKRRMEALPAFKKTYPPHWKD